MICTAVQQKSEYIKYVRKYKDRFILISIFQRSLYFRTEWNPYRTAVACYAFSCSSLSLCSQSLSPKQQAPECRKEEDREHGHLGVRWARVGPSAQVLVPVVIEATRIRPCSLSLEERRGLHGVSQATASQRKPAHTAAPRKPKIRGPGSAQNAVPLMHQAKVPMLALSLYLSQEVAAIARQTGHTAVQSQVEHQAGKTESKLSAVSHGSAALSRVPSNGAWF